MKSWAPLLLAVFAACGSRVPTLPGDESPRPPDTLDGQARAVRVSSLTELLSGPMAKGQIGDLKIWNSKVSFIVAAARAADGYGPYGGKVVAADRTRREDEPGASVYGEVLSAYDVRTPRAEIVEVVADGRDGRAAVIRSRGPDSVVPVAEDLISRGAPTRPLGVEITTDFVLEPGAEALKIVTRLRNMTPQAKPIALNLTLFIFGDGAQNFFPGVGFTQPRRGQTAPFFASVAPTVSYGWFASDDVGFFFDYHSLSFCSYPVFTVPIGGEHVETRYLAIGTGDVESLARIRAGIFESDRRATIRGVVTDERGKPTPGALVHLVAANAASGDGYLSNARADENGGFSFATAPGPYELYATLAGHPQSERVPITASAAGTREARLSLASTGQLAVAVRDARTQQPIPAKIVVRMADDSAPPRFDKRFGEINFPDKVAAVAFVPPGGARIELPPGRYRATLSRGFEYTIAQPAFDVRAGAETVLTESLDRVVDTTGFLSGDFHVHAQYSPDSSDTLEHKVLASAAEGLEVPVATEHEYIVDWKPAIEATGLTRWVTSITGEEVTTGGYGHFNAFPLSPDRGAPNGGAIEWFYMSPPRLFDYVTTTFPSAIWQVNHPRSPSVGGYFSAVGFDPRSGIAVVQPTWWSEKFHAIEVVNGPDGYTTFLRETFADWASFLNRGKHVTATGNSDSHTALLKQVGYPRNLVASSTDDPSRLDEAEFIANVRKGNVIVSGGPFVTARIETTTPGSLHRPSAAGNTARLRVKVQAPPWIGLNRLEVIANGVVVSERALDPTTAATVRFDGAIDLALTRDSWVIAHVSGDGTLGDIVPGARPFAFTNPIYVDVDRNGRFDPPGQ